MFVWIFLKPMNKDNQKQKQWTKHESNWQVFNSESNTRLHIRCHLRRAVWTCNHSWLRSVCIQTSLVRAKKLNRCTCFSRDAKHFRRKASFIVHKWCSVARMSLRKMPKMGKVGAQVVRKATQSTGRGYRDTPPSKVCINDNHVSTVATIWRSPQSVVSFEIFQMSAKHFSHTELVV